MFSFKFLQFSHVVTIVTLMLLAVLTAFPYASIAQAADTPPASGGGSSGTLTPLDSKEGINKTVCSVVNTLQGPIARGIAAVGIIFLGFSLFLGKISWGIALALAIGIGAIFGADKIVGMLGDGKAACADFTKPVQ